MTSSQICEKAFNIYIDLDFVYLKPTAGWHREILQVYSIYNNLTDLFQHHARLKALLGQTCCGLLFAKVTSASLPFFCYINI